MSGDTIRAAGGVLWRPGPDGPAVALVHRPKYDDWSLPKGKLDPGEPDLLAAVREVREETGCTVTVGRPLGLQRYIRHLDSGDVPKTVRFWSMLATGGEFVPDEEVDALEWLPVDAARGRVTEDRDRRTLDHFEDGPLLSTPVALVRHARAGQRGAWPGDDRERPLDPTGKAQALALVPMLHCFGFQRVLSADVLRCLDTIGPFAREASLVVESEPLVSESGYAAAPEAAVTRAIEVVCSPQPTVLCSQGRVLPDLIRRLCSHFGVPQPGSTTLAKGAFWVLHLHAGRLLGLERHRPGA